MIIKLNGQDKEIDQQKIIITDLLKFAGVAKPELVSVQLNENFVNRENFNSTEVVNGDEVDFLFFMGGGSR